MGEIAARAGDCSSLHFSWILSDERADDTISPMKRQILRELKMEDRNLFSIHDLLSTFLCG
jgi:hypothetical protein